jgi:hypothetical protein
MIDEASITAAFSDLNPEKELFFTVVFSGRGFLVPFKSHTEITVKNDQKNASS